MIVDLEQKSGISAYCRTKSARSKYISDWKPQEGWITDSTRTFGGWRKHGIKATKDWKFVWGSVKCNKVKIKLKKKKKFQISSTRPCSRENWPSFHFADEKKTQLWDTYRLIQQNNITKMPIHLFDSVHGQFHNS